MFQLTLPLRGATSILQTNSMKLHVSTHAPLAGSDLWPTPPSLRTLVSTHAPLAGSDSRMSARSVSTWPFQLTLPLRGATAVGELHHRADGVSTHAPLAGSDIILFFVFILPECFNSRSPCGERRGGQGCTTSSEWSQLTLPLRGATVRSCGVNCE